MLLDGKRIFFVEDDGKNVAIIFSILKNNGAEVKFAPWTYAVSEMEKFMPIDIILLDMMLPGKDDGFSIFQKIQETPSLQGIPVAAVTALESASAMNKAREMGFKGYINKPIRVATFPQYVAEIIDGGEIWGNPED
jgi:two-component system cell cycle response regulator DivK